MEHFFQYSGHNLVVRSIRLLWRWNTDIHFSFNYSLLSSVAFFVINRSFQEVIRTFPEFSGSNSAKRKVRKEKSNIIDVSKRKFEHSTSFQEIIVTFLEFLGHISHIPGVSKTYFSHSWSFQKIVRTFSEFSGCNSTIPEVCKRKAERLRPFQEKVRPIT